MAAGQATECPQLKDLTCPICLNIFTDPRLLPCHHSFCSSCIKDVANSNGGRTFPCPTCRKSTAMPSNGVSGFQSNFYLAGELQNIKAVKFYCATHPRDELDMYCTECKVAACHKCARTKHTERNINHLMENLSDAAKKAKDQLRKDKERLATAAATLKKTVAATEQEKQDIQRKTANLKQNITNKHAVMIAAANKAREDALAELTKTANILEAELNKDLAGEKQDLATVEKLQKNVEDAINRDVECQIVEVSKEMAEGSGSTSRVQKLTSHNRTQISRPVLRSSETAENATKGINGYIGRADHQVFKSESASATVERSKIPEDSGAEVFSIAVDNDGKVTMSYTWKSHSTAASSEKFDSKGTHTATYNENQGQASWVSRGNSCSLYDQTPGKFKTLGKSYGYSLNNDMKGTGNIYKHTVVQEEPYESKADHVFSIKCGPHRAFDASPDGQLFAVLEEPTEKGQSGTVKLYRRPAQNASTSVQPQPEPITYSSPIIHFKPSDVCFLDDDKLLIADEGNDAIHVVTAGAEPSLLRGRQDPFFRHSALRDAEMSFHSFLAIGNPLLVQPTAMTLDKNGGLWVACRDRQIFVFRNIEVPKIGLSGIIKNVASVMARIFKF